MSSIAIDQIAAALEREGLLSGRRGDLPSRVRGIADDSRLLGSGSLFVAVHGSAQDGHDFLDAAAAKGAIAAIVEDPARTQLPVLLVGAGRRAAAVAAAATY
jgi:UDP-N-acetylmuramoyl-tripeptide--D-alanyl-D-alanine ligase